MSMSIFRQRIEVNYSLAKERKALHPYSLFQPHHRRIIASPLFSSTLVPPPPPPTTPSSCSTLQNLNPSRPNPDAERDTHAGRTFVARIRSECWLRAADEKSSASTFNVNSASEKVRKWEIERHTRLFAHAQTSQRESAVHLMS